MENINDLMPLSTDWNKERLTKLKNIFPDLFTNEGKLNIDELKKVIDPQSVSEIERYEFRWFGKSEAKRNAYTPSNATLVFDEQRSVNPNESENIIIEGENLEALKLLSESYREKIKCIYIDPPYNTGKDFIYSDNYTEDKKPYWEQTGVTENGLKIDTNTETDGRFHSNWLNMMYSRLLISRTLLREDGVIFISIDDNEVHHLKKLCDEVFGEDNFIAQITIITGANQSGEGVRIQKNTEYCIVYSKINDSDCINRVDKVNETYRNLNDAPTPLETRDEMGYTIYYNESTQEIIPLKDYDKTKIFKNDIKEVYSDNQELINKGFIPIRPGFRNKKLHRWRWGLETFIERKEEIVILKKDNEFNVAFKQEGLNPPKNYLNFGGGTPEIKELFNDDQLFDYPKSFKYIKYLTSIGSGYNDIILDFFGGSGTTGQAVMELNKEDGGNRKYILIQIPEATDEKSEAFKAGYKKISSITIERNKRVVEKLIKERKKQQPGLFTNGQKDDAIKGLGFKVFKLVKSNFPRVEWAPEVDKTEAENIELLKKYIKDKEAQLITAFNRDELLTEILFKNGFQLNYKADKQEQFNKNEILLASDGIKETLICLDILINADTVEHFKTHTDKKFICLERALDTTKKYNLKHYLGDKFNAF